MRNLAPLATWEDRKDAAISKTLLVLVEDSDGTVVLTEGRSGEYVFKHDASDVTWSMVEVS